MNGNLYGNVPAFQAHHRARRASAVKARIAQAELSTEAKSKLRALLSKDLRDLGIQETEVF